MIFFMVFSLSCRVDLTKRKNAGTWKTWAMRGLISRPTWRSIKASCAVEVVFFVTFSQALCANTTYLQPADSCQTVLNLAAQEMGNLFNPYDLDVPMCASEGDLSP
jgi:hypothetical protein